MSEVKRVGLGRTTFATFIGTVLEQHDFTIYAHLSPIIVPLCFPHMDSAASRMHLLATFAFGYLFRPIGGLVFGHFGDKFGRKKPMVISIILMSFPTLALACLPTYAQVGALSGFVLYLCRSIQSISVGGELAGASTILLENAPLQRKSLFSSIQGMAFWSGSMIGAVSAWFFTQPFMPSWGWRISFSIGSFIAIVGFYMRKNAVETPEFLVVIEQKKVLKSPILATLRKDWRSHLCWIGLTYVGIYAYMILYVPMIMKNNFGYSVSESLVVTICFMSLILVCLPIFGLLADRFGAKKVMSLGIFLVALIMPFSLRAMSFATPSYFFLFHGLACIAFAAQAAPNSTIGKYMYPTERRYSGSSFGLGVAALFVMAFGPRILESLTFNVGGFWGPVLYITCLQIAAFLAMTFAPSFLKTKSSS
jgi:MHS family proline/betaine transporter-like MFS transporter